MAKVAETGANRWRPDRRPHPQSSLRGDLALDALEQALYDRPIQSRSDWCTAIGLYKAEVIRKRGPWRGIEDVEFATPVAWYNGSQVQESLR
jgi:hypothetical protein